MKVNHINQTEGKTTEQQMRLRLRIAPGRFLDLPAVPNSKPILWAWPGGTHHTYGALARLCRSNGWSAPELLPVIIKRRIDDKEETHGQ